MAKKNEMRIDEVYERNMREFMRQISEFIRNIRVPADENKSDVRKNDPDPDSKETRPSLQEEHSGPDKINEIRHEAAADQSAETQQTIEIRNPDKQNELMEIVKQRIEEFERELRGLKSLDSKAVESAAQKFKSDLMDIARKQLTEKYRLSTS